jgi:hypothetical protein
MILYIIIIDIYSPSRPIGQTGGTLSITMYHYGEGPQGLKGWGISMHKIIKQIDTYWERHMKDDTRNDPSIPGIKPNDGKRKPTAREIMFQLDVQALADKYRDDDITIIAEARNGDIIEMWGPILFDEMEDEPK